jgi:Ca2+-binding RTX toxin-like protein
MPTFTVSDWRVLDAETMTNLFLYGTFGTPDKYNSRIRTNNDPVTVVLDMSTTAATGPGSPIPPLTPFVQQFFSIPSSFSNLHGQISVGALKSAYGYQNLDFTIPFQQAFLDVGQNDYANRMYVWNSQAVRLGDDTVFDFDNRTMSDVTYRYVDEDFDFTGSSLATVGGLVLQPNIDPYNLGQTVEIQYRGSSGIQYPSYDTQQFRADSASWIARNVGIPPIPVMSAAADGIIEQLTNDGVITYFMEDGRPIIYGSTQADDITKSSVRLAEPSQVDGFAAVGGPGNDKLTGDSGDDILLGGQGNDILSGSGENSLSDSGGNNYLDGGPGTDTAIYDAPVVVLSSGGAAPAGPGFAPDDDAPFFRIDHGDGIDVLHSIEKLKLSGQAQTFRVTATGLSALDYLEEVDGGSQSGGTRNVLDLTLLAKSFTFDHNQIQGYKTEFKNFNVLLADPGNVKVILNGPDAASWQEVDFGDGNDVITSDVVNLKINLGNGDDIVGTVGRGTIVNAGTGKDSFIASDDELITGTTPQDQIFSKDGILLRGAVGRIGSEDPWIVGPDGTRYGKNGEGDLVIKDKLGDLTYVADYHGGPDLPYSQQTAGILLSKTKNYAQLLLSLDRPYITYIQDTFKAGNEQLYTQTGKTFFNADPLVFDLSGNGIDLTSLDSTSPLLDMRGTGFAVHSGWVGPSNGILVLQGNGSNGTPTLIEMFGGTGATGFEALASYDSNADGVINATDTVFSQLRIWADVNGNGVADAGELETLTQAGVASINLASTAQTGVTNAGNAILATGSFSRTDGTTGDIAQVNFNVDTFHSTYLGDTTVSAAAAALPDLKGYGTLADLRVAMTLDPALIDTVTTNLADLDVPDLAALRTAALPIFVAWAQAVQLPDADGNPQAVDPAAGHSDVPILIETDAAGHVTVDDYAYKITDESGSYWKLASGHFVVDAEGAIIGRPTVADVMAQAAPVGTPAAAWTDVTAAEIGFMEREYGQPFPIDQVPDDPAAMLAAMSDFINGSFSAMTLEAVRLAVQAGPLSHYFPGIGYDAVADKFTATTDGQLTPMYEAIFAAAPGDAAGATAWLVRWKPIIDVVLGDFARGSGLDVTYGYQFTSMVNAYEALGLPIDIKAAAEALGIPSGLIVDGGATLTGPDQSSIYYLHGGDQIVTAGLGMNNFVMGGTFGHDVIIDDEPAPSAQDPSILRFSNVKSTDVTATRDGLDLILDVNGTNEEVRVVGEFTGVRPGFNGSGNLNDTMGVAQVAFSDGVVWDMPDISWAVSRPDSAHAVITGTPDMDVLDGGVGGDTSLSGGDGGDIYIFGRGYGHDTIHVQRTDPLNAQGNFVKFGPNVSFSDLTFSREGSSNDLQISINGTNDRLTIVDQFAAGYSAYGPLWTDRVEGFAFADGSSRSWDDVIQMLDSQATGQPIIYGFDYEDTLDGGPGVHYLSGGNENDTYIFDPGTTFDIVKDNISNPLGGLDDTIALGVDTPQDATFSLQGNAGDMLITLGDGSTMLVKGEFTIDIGSLSFDRIESFAFGNGTTLSYTQVLQQIISAAETSGNDVVTGSDFGDILDGGAGNDYLSGRNGADTYVFGHGSGHDTIDVNWTELLNSGSSAVHFKADVSASDVQWSRLGNDLVIKLNGSNDSLTVLGQFTDRYSGAGVAAFVFADGTTLSAADAQSLAASNAMTGTSGADTIQSAATDDVLSGGDGNDTYVYARGDGFDRIETGKTPGLGTVDTLSFTDIASTDVTLMRWPGRGINDLVIAIDGQNGAPQGQVTVAGQFAYGENVADAAINRITFSDGVTWTEADIEAKLIALEEAQTGANVGITGFGGADTLTATAGVATLVGGNGADTYVWSAGDGATFISDQGRMDDRFSDQIDTLRIHGLAPADVTVSRNPDPASHDLVLASPGQSPIVLVNQTLHESSSVIEQVMFDDGTVWDYTDLLLQADGGIASAANGTTARSFAGAAASSTLTGTASDDVYFWGAGDGNDTINEGDYDVWQKADALRLTGLNAGDVTFNIVENGSRDLLITNKATGETLTVHGQFASASNDGSNAWAGAGTGVERIVFADGTVWSPQQILDNSVYLAVPGAVTVENLDLGDGTIAMQASPGVQMLYGLGNSADTYIWTPGDGSDTITDTNGTNNSIDTLRLAGVARTDLKFAQAGNDLIVTDTTTGESITVKYQFLNVGVGDGVEQVVFDDGTIWDRAQIKVATWLVGTAAADTIVGTDGDDTIQGKGGADTLLGGYGNDTYLYASGDGNDLIRDIGHNFETDVLKLTNLNSSDVTFARSIADPNDLLINVTATGEVITVDDHFLGSATGIEQIQFADGTIWNRSQIQAGSSLLQGTSGADTITGTDGDDNIAGKGGDDTLLGGYGNDTYVYAAGDGNDLIRDIGYNFNNDVLKLTNLNAADVTFARSIADTNDLLINITATGEVITVDDHFLGTATGLEQIQFADGTIWNRSQIQAVAWLQGTPGADTITGTDGDDTILGKGGADTLLGGYGNDTYVYASGDGNDLIRDIGFNFNNDVLKLTNLNASDVTFGRSAADTNDLLINITATGETITVDDHFLGTATGLEQIQFANGTTWNRSQIQAAAWLQGTSGADTITGTDGDDIIAGKGGDDTLLGGYGNDTYVYASGDGNDLIRDIGYNFNNDLLKLTNLNVSDVTFGRSIADTNDLLINITATGETITVDDHFLGTATGLEQIQFADGTTWSRSQIQAVAWLQGTSAAETITGTDGDDTIQGKGGADTLLGGHGNDAYVYASGDGNDVIREVGYSFDTDILKLTNLNSSDVTFARPIADPNDLMINVTATGEAIIVDDHFLGTATGIEQIQFADGTIWNRSQIQAAAWLQGTSAAETITGTDGDDTILGKGGADTLLGGYGNDTYVYASGDGNDLIRDIGYNFNADVLKLSNLNAADGTFGRSIADTNDLLINITATGEVITVDDQFLGSATGIEQIQFANGTTWNGSQIQAAAWLRGTAGPETITGTDGDDTIQGKGGDDTLLGGNGNDTYVYAAGDGSDLVRDIGHNFETDVLKLSNLNAADVSLAHLANNNLLVAINATGEVITVENHFAGTSTGLEQIQFADGTTWDRTAIQAHAALVGTSGADTINGTSANETLDGLAGNDTLNGGGGYDTYKFGAGFGQDVINNFASDGSGSPKGEIDFASGIDHSQLWLQRSGNNLLIDLLGTNNVITVDDWYAGNARNQVQSINAGDGSKLDSQIAQLVSAMATYSADNSSFDPTQTSQMPNDQNLQTVLAAAWHA